MSEQEKSRREVLRSVVRVAALGGLAATGVGLAAKRLTNPVDERCTLQSPCRGCPSFGGCRLPRASAARRESPAR